MAGAIQSHPRESYPILVRTPKTSTENLSMKLEKYFQSKSSGGGECEVTKEDEETYTVMFKHEEAQKRVLSKEKHELQENNLQLVIEIYGDKIPLKRNVAEKECDPYVSTENEARTKSNTFTKRSSSFERKPTTDKQNLDGRDMTEAGKERPYLGQSEGEYNRDSHRENGAKGKSGEYPYRIPDPKKQSMSDDKMFDEKIVSRTNWDQSEKEDDIDNPPKYQERTFNEHTSRNMSVARRESPDMGPMAISNPTEYQEIAKSTQHANRTSAQEEQSTADGFFDVIFTEVSAKLNTKIFSQEVRNGVTARFPSLRVTKKTSRGVEEVTGTYSEIDEVYKYLQQVHQKVKDCPSQEETRPLHPEHSVTVGSALYDYFYEIYPDVVKKIRGEFNVDMRRASDPDTVNLMPLSPDANIDRAKQILTDTIQKITLDWKQNLVNLPEGRIISAEDIKQTVKKHSDKTLVIVEDSKVILRGPEREIANMKKLLEDGLVTSSRPQEAVKISSHGMKRELIVNAEYLQILHKLKSRDINEIEHKYDVKMQVIQGDAGSMKVAFRSLNGSPDLGVHALQIFLNLLQKTITNIDRKVITMAPDFQEGQIPLLEEELNMAGFGIMLQYSKGTVTLIGSPSHVWAAENKLNPKGKSPKPTNSAEGGEWELLDISDSSSSVVKSGPKEDEEKCPICMEKLTNKKILDKCKHVFCSECAQKAMSYKPVCPVCNIVYGVIEGDQPDGRMNDSTSPMRLPGFDCGTITITYDIYSGIQGKNHPNPGKPFHGTHRTAYLPDNTEGREILGLLRKAFNQRLIFTVGESRTTSKKDTVTWNDIHHKTSPTGGTHIFGYPDPDYLKRVREELKAKGIE
ncbi:E3 ubiquitin-protein ligase DTX3L-like [Discoglossus pictus]